MQPCKIWKRERVHERVTHYSSLEKFWRERELKLERWFHAVFNLVVHMTKIVITEVLVGMFHLFTLCMSFLLFFSKKPEKFQIISYDKNVYINTS